MDLGEQEMIGSILADSEDDITLSPMQPRTEPQRTYSPQLTRKQNYPEFRVQTPIIGFSSSDKWAIQPFSLDQEDDLDGDLILKCKDQQSSRRVQQLFQKGTLQVRQLIFDKLQKGLKSLANDVFGNYVVQNLLEHGTKEQREYIFEELNGQIVSYSFNQYGCRVAQKLLEIYYFTDKFDILFQQLRPRVRELVVDASGNHVVQKIVELAKGDISYWIIEGVQGQIYKLSDNSHGCRLIQQTLETARNNEVLIYIIQLCIIYDELLHHINDLCVSQYGNYIVQLLIQRSSMKVIQNVQDVILNNLERLSSDKFGSNVVDKAVQNSNGQFKRDMMKVLLSNLQLFYRLSNHAYGNYVIQNFCKQSDTKSIQQICAVMDPVMFKSSFGQHVYQTLLKLK